MINMVVPTTRQLRRTHTGQAYSRRAGACMPCRDSKSRCNGELPCSKCVSKRSRPDCRYPQTPRVSTRPASAGQSGGSRTSQGDGHRENEQRSEVDELAGSFSLCRVVDKFKSLRDIDGPHAELINRVELFDIVPARSAPNLQEEQRPQSASSAAYENSASPTDLPLPGMHFPFGLPDRLQTLQTKISASRKALDRGQLLQSWIDVPSLMREAQVSGCEPQDKPSQESMLKTQEQQRQRWIWTEIVELDIALSFCLGRPFCVHSAQTIKKPVVTDVHPHLKILQASRQKFIAFMLETFRLLVPDPCSDRSSSPSPELSEQELRQQLKDIETSLPSLSHSEPRPARIVIAFAEYHLEFHLFSLVFLCHLASSAWSRQDDAAELPDVSVAEKTSQTQANGIDASDANEEDANRAEQDLYADIVRCARETLHVFGILHQHCNPASGIGWRQSFGTLSAALVLWIAVLSSGSDDDADLVLIQEYLTILQDLEARNIGHAMYETAATWIDKAALNQVRGHLAGVGAGKNADLRVSSTSQVVPLTDRPDPEGLPDQDDSHAAVATKRHKTDDGHMDPASSKRRRFDPQMKPFEPRMMTDSGGWITQDLQNFGTHVVAGFPGVMVGSLDTGMPTHGYRDLYAHSQPTSAATSFAENEHLSFASVGLMAGSDMTDLTGQMSHPWLPGWPYHPPQVLHPPMALPQYDWAHGAMGEDQLDMSNIAIDHGMAFTSDLAVFQDSIGQPLSAGLPTPSSPVTEAKGGDHSTPKASLINTRPAYVSPELRGQAITQETIRRNVPSGEHLDKSHYRLRTRSKQGTHGSRPAQADTIQNTRSQPLSVWNVETPSQYSQLKQTQRAKGQHELQLGISGNDLAMVDEIQSFSQPGTGVSSRRSSLRGRLARRKSMPAIKSDHEDGVINTNVARPATQSFGAGVVLPDDREWGKGLTAQYVGGSAMVATFHNDDDDDDDDNDENNEDDDEMMPMYDENNQVSYQSISNVYQPYLNTTGSHHPMVTTGPLSGGHHHHHHQQHYWHG